MDEWIKALVSYHTTFQGSVYINTIFYISEYWQLYDNFIEMYFICVWVGVGMESAWRATELIIMRRAISSGFLKLIFYLGSLHPFLFSSIPKWSWMTLYIFVLYHFPHLTPWFKIMCCFPLVHWIKSILLYFYWKAFHKLSLFSNSHKVSSL